MHQNNGCLDLMQKVIVSTKGSDAINIKKK